MRSSCSSWWSAGADGRAGVCVHPVDRWRPPAAPACTWIALRLAELQQLVVHLVAARWPGHAAAAVGADGLHVDRAAAGRAAAAGGAPGCRQVARACGRAGQAGGLQVPMVELACGRQADRWRAPAAVACRWIALQLIELLPLVLRRAANLWAVRAPGRPMVATSRAGLHVDRAAAGRAAAARGAPGCRQVARACGRAGQAGGLQVPMVELACGRQADRWRAPAAVACRWIALQLIELLPLVLRRAANLWAVRAPGRPMVATSCAGLQVDRAAAGRAAVAGGAPGCRQVVGPCGRAAAAGGLQVPMVELACGRQADRWRAPAAVACMWIALRLAELLSLVVHLVAARWSGHAAALASAGGLHVAELLPLVLRRAATRWAVRAPGRPMVATSRAGLHVDRAAAGRAAAARGAPGCCQVARPCGRAGQAGGLQVPMAELACGRQADRWRAPAAVACRWIALQLAELQQLVVRLVAARWSGHAAELAGADGLHWIALQVAELLSLVPRRVAAWPGTARMLAGATVCRCRWSSWPVGARPTDGVHQPRWPACGSRCSWPSCSSSWCTWLPPGGRAMRPRWPAPTVCTWIAPRLIDLQQLVVCRCRWSSWRVRAPGRPMAATSCAGLQVDRAAAGRAVVAGGAPGCRQVVGPCGRAGRRRRSAGGRAAAAGAAPCGHPVGCACTWSTDGGHQLRRSARGSRCGWPSCSSWWCAWLPPGGQAMRPSWPAPTACTGSRCRWPSCCRWCRAVWPLGPAPRACWPVLVVCRCRWSSWPVGARPTDGVHQPRRPARGSRCGWPSCSSSWCTWLPPGGQAMRPRRSAPTVCTWIALRLVELQQLVVHLVAARWPGHAAALARLVVCRCRWSSWPVGARPTDGVHQPRWPACGSRCSWPSCSSSWCTWLPPGGRAMRPRWPAPTACAWIALRLADLQQLVVHLVAARWSGHAAALAGADGLHVDCAAADRSAAAGGLQVPMVELACACTWSTDGGHQLRRSAG